MPAVTFEPAIVAQMMEQALEFCAEKSGLKGKDQAVKALGKGDCCVCEYMRYALGKSVGEYLGSVDDTVRAVYSFEPEYSIDSNAPFFALGNASPGMHLIAHVSRKSAALLSVVAAMDAALAEERKKLGCPNAKAPCFDLDVRVADDDEVKRRMGFGALIESQWVKPVEVWSR